MGIGGERGAAAEHESAQFFPLEERPSTPAPRPGGDAPEAKPRPQGVSTPWLLRVWQSLLSLLQAEFAKDTARGAGFLCLPVLLAAGAATYFALPREPDVLQVSFSVAVLVLAVWLARKRPVFLTILGAMLVFALGVGAAKLETWRASTAMLGSDVTTNITGRLVRLEHQANGRVRLTIDVQETERPRLHYPPDQIRLTARSAPPDLQPGDGVSGLVRLMSPSGPVRPGSYDFSFTSYFSGRGAVGFFMSGPDRMATEEALPLTARPARWLERVRQALAARIRAQVGGPEGEVAVAIITGFREGIPEEINEWLRRAGLAHVLAISGLHMALVAATIMFMLRAACALFPGFSSGIPVKKYAAAAALALCTLYLFVSGAAVAAQRSYIMLAVMLAALIFDRAALTMRNVAIAALIIIVVSPHEVVGPSFQMSFAATAALIAAYAAWTNWRRERDNRRAAPADLSIPMRSIRATLLFFAGLAATSVIAGVATTLYGVWHFQRVSPLALPANLAAMPLVSLVAMPSAVLAMLALPFGLDGFFVKIMGHAIGAMITVARWFSDRSPIDAVGFMPLSAMLVLTIALVVLVVSTTRLRWLALPLVLVGIVLTMTRELPDAVVTEDARLIGLRGSDNSLAVNRTRPNGFTMGDWTHALAAKSVLKPDNGEARPLPESVAEPGGGFICGQGLCLARHKSGALIAHAESAEAARMVCQAATLIILDYATARNPCLSAPATVITKRDLARNGSAAIVFRRNASGLRADVTFATPEPWRAWHAHRKWSRAARGLSTDR